MINYRFDCAGVSRQALEAVFVAAGLGGRQGERILRAFQNSSHVCLAFDFDRLVGTSRSISDGEYHAFIYDVAVLPDYQGQGIGRQMVAHLLKRAPVWRTLLRADADVQAFYAQLGFGPYADILARFEPGFVFDPRAGIDPAG